MTNVEDREAAARRKKNLEQLSASERKRRTKVPETANQDPSIPVLNFEEFVAFDDEDNPDKEEERFKKAIQDDEDSTTDGKTQKKQKIPKKTKVINALTNKDTGIASIVREFPFKQNLVQKFKNRIEGNEQSFVNHFIYEYSRFLRKVLPDYPFEAAYEYVEEVSSHHLFQEELTRIRDEEVNAVLQSKGLKPINIEAEDYAYTPAASSKPAEVSAPSRAASQAEQGEAEFNFEEFEQNDTEKTRKKQSGPTVPVKDTMTPQERARLRELLGEASKAPASKPEETEDEVAKASSSESEKEEVQEPAPKKRRLKSNKGSKPKRPASPVPSPPSLSASVPSSSLPAAEDDFDVNSLPPLPKRPRRKK